MLSNYDSWNNSSQLKNNHIYNFSHLYDIIISTPCHSNSIRSFISSSQCEMERWQIYLSKSILLGIEFMYIRLTSNVYGENICVYIYLCIRVCVIGNIVICDKVIATKTRYLLCGRWHHFMFSFPFKYKVSQINFYQTWFIQYNCR